MNKDADRYRWLLQGGAMAAAVVLVLRLWIAIPLFSPTTDEPAHIGAAVAMVEAHKAIATVSHPPLPRWVMAVPLWLDGARLPQCRGLTVVGKEDTGYAWGTQVLYHSPTPFRAMLTHVRRVMLIFPLLALFYLYRLTALLANEKAACFATIFFSVDPTLLGHGFWACSDVAGCAGTLAALFYGYRWINHPTLWRAVCAGIAIGLGISLKFSGLFVVPALGIVWIFVERKRGADIPKPASEVPRRPGFFSSLKRSIVHLPIITLAAFLALWATYAFNIDALGNQTVLGQLPQWQRLPHWVRFTPVPMPSFFLGVLRLIGQNHVGLRSYLNGNISNSGWWYYFPEVLFLKSTIGFLAAMVVAAVAWMFEPAAETKRTATMLLVPLAVFAAFTLTAKYDLGIRYILPSIALLYVLIGWQLARGRGVVLLTALMLISAFETAGVHPNYLSFFNRAVGGSTGGEHYALDSNLDWNQDLYRLADYIHTHPAMQPYSLRLTGERNGPLLQAIAVDATILNRPVHGSVLLISKNKRLVGPILPWLARHQPIATIGVSIDVYDLRATAGIDEPEDVPPPDEPRRG